jgi:hypothetical protein
MNMIHSFRSEDSDYGVENVFLHRMPGGSTAAVTAYS